MIPYVFAAMKRDVSLGRDRFCRSRLVLIMMLDRIVPLSWQIDTLVWKIR